MFDSKQTADQATGEIVAKAVWERPTIESYQVADLTMGIGGDPLDGINNLS